MPTSGLALNSRYIKLPNGITLHMLERPGTGSPVICLHGIWDKCEYFLSLVASAFPGRPMYLVDHRGHGRSDKPESGYGWDDYAGDLIALIEWLGAGKVTLVGHSLGANTSLLAAARIPERIESMVLEDPPIPLRKESAGVFLSLLELKQQPFEKVVEELQIWRPWVARADVEATARRLTGTADGVLREAGNGILANVEIPVPGVQIPAPTLIIQAGIEEQRAFADSGREIVAAVSPNLTIETIPDTSHNVLREAPEPYLEVLARFNGA